MGGGGGAGPVSRDDANWLQTIRRVDVDKYEAETNELLKAISSSIGARDDEAIHRHVEVLAEKLAGELVESIDVQFGGSLSKHTYVDGVSDVDALVLLGQSEVADETSRSLIQRMAELIHERLPDTQVTTGDMAVTVTYQDGIELQLLPAILRGSRVQVPGGKHGDWSPIADPRRFANELKAVNASKSLLVVPVIKLFKAMEDVKLPPDLRLSGYHVESLAVGAFGDYSGPLERKAMLEHLVERASTGVLSPLADTTGQSSSVDEYLGAPNSPQRRTASAYLQRLRDRMRAADKTGDAGAWAELFGEE